MEACARSVGCPLSLTPSPLNGGAPTFVNLRNVRVEKKEALIKIAEEIKAADGKKGNLDHEQAYVRLRLRKDLTLDRAVDEAVSQMAILKMKLDTVR